MNERNGNQKIIAVASGKGGTGKTTIATNLAWLAASNGQSVCYLDCDVEEPNGHLFLKPQIEHSEPVAMEVPEVDETICTLCGQCGEICEYNAIVCVGERVLTFYELCHACGGCWLVCPEKAISETPRSVGMIDQGKAAGVRFVQGRLEIGQAMATPVVRAAKQRMPNEGLVILDAPPGTSCPVVETIRDSDCVLLVTEPTPFGLNDLRLAVETVRTLNLPLSVVINRSDAGDASVRNYCLDEGIEVVAEVLEDRKVAEIYSRGEIIVDALPRYREAMAALLERLHECVGAELGEVKTTARRSS